MDRKKISIDFNLLSNLLGGDSAYENEFCEAGIESFSSFQKEYSDYLLARDLENLKKSGHRIKPVAQMLEVEELLDEYEKGKKLLKNEEAQKYLEESAENVDHICDQIARDFREKLKAS